MKLRTEKRLVITVGSCVLVLFLIFNKIDGTNRNKYFMQSLDIAKVCSSKIGVRTFITKITFDSENKIWFNTRAFVQKATLQKIVLAKIS